MNFLGLNISRAERLPPKQVIDTSAIPAAISTSDPSQRMIPAVPSEYYQMLPKLTPLQIRMLLLSGMSGNFSWMYDLVSIMQDTWPRLLKNLHEVSDACRNTKFDARPYTETGEKPTDSAEEKADFVNRCLKSFEPIPGGDERNFSGTVYDMSKAIVMPRLQEIIWKQNDKGEWQPRATAWVHSRRLGLLPSGRIGIQPVLDQDISYATTQNRAPVDLPPNKFIYSIYPTRDGALTMSGLLRPLAWWWGSMMYGRDWLLIYAQLFGQPFRWATYKTGMPERDQVALGKMMSDWGSAGYGIFQDGVLINTVDSKGVAQDNPQRFLVEHADEYADLLIKGETLTDRTQGNQGQMRGNSQVGHKVRNQRIEGMCSWLADDLTDQLVRPIMVLNYGNTDEMPRIVADFNEPTTGLEQAQMAQIWLNIYDMEATDAAELSGLPLVKKADPILPVGQGAFGKGGKGNGNGNGKGDNANLQAVLRAIASGNGENATDKLSRETLQQFAEGLASANLPLIKRLKALDAIHDDAEWLIELRHLLLDFPDLARECLAHTKPAAEALSNGMAASMVNGLATRHEAAGVATKRF